MPETVMPKLSTEKQPAAGNCGDNCGCSTTRKVIFASRPRRRGLVYQAGRLRRHAARATR